MVRQPKKAQVFSGRGNNRSQQTNVMFAMVSGGSRSGADRVGEEVVPGTDDKAIDSEIVTSVTTRDISSGIVPRQVRQARH